MTILEKITNLNWFDFLRKIKDILNLLSNNSIEGVITNTVSSASTLDVVFTGKVNYHTFTGSTSDYFAPEITNNTGKRIVIINQGSGSITLNSFGGLNTIWESDVLSSSLMIPKATTVSLYNNGNNWSVLGA